MPDSLSQRLKSKPSIKAATIAVIIRSNKILLGLRDYTDGPTVWTAPGGSVDKGETLEEATRRETKEETGIINLEFISYIGNVKAEDRDLLHIFHCKTEDDPELAEPEKFREWIWYPIEDFSSGKLENYISESARLIIVDYLFNNDTL